jgi:hypothetical protein
MRASLLHGAGILAAALSLYACDSEGPTSESPIPAPSAAVQKPSELRTAADTAAFLKKRGERRALKEASPSVLPMFGVPGYCFSGANSSPTGIINGGISMCAGDTLVVTVTFAECSGVEDTMRVDGPVNFILSTDACNDVGATHTEIATVAGNLRFTMIDPRFGSGSWRTSGTYPDLIVGMEEGFGDLDYDDNVLTVHLGRRPCPPTGNPILDDPANRQKFDSSFQATNPIGPQSQRKEHIRAGYKFPDGHIESVDLNPPSANNCAIPTLSLPLTNGAGKLAWIWHSHPFAPGELVTICGGVSLGMAKPYPATPSKEDWDFLDQTNQRLFANGEPPIDGFIYDHHQSMWMKHNTVGQPPQDNWDRFDHSSCQN